MTEQLATETPPADPAVLNAGDPPVDPAPQPEPQPEPEPAARMIPADVLVREVTPLRAKNRELESALDEHRRKLSEANELLARMQRGNGADPPAPAVPGPRQPDQQFSQADIDRRALELNFQRDAQQVNSAGRTAYGADWDSSVGLLSTFGLDTPDFVSSIMDVAGCDKTHDVVRAITVDPSIVAGLASMSPAQRIREITRISDRMTAKSTAATPTAPATPAAAPARNISRAPPPAPRVDHNASKVLNWDTDQDKMSDEEWSRNWNDRWSKRAGRR